MLKLKSQEAMEELREIGFDVLLPDMDVGFNALAPNVGDSGSKECLIAYINLTSGRTGRCQPIWIL